MFMGNSKVFLGLNNIKSIMLGIQGGKLFLGETKLYPLEKPIGDAVVSCDDATYNGSVQTAQNIVVTLSGVTLVAGTDYTVTSNTGGTNVGTYVVEVTGAGDYTGTTSGIFTINKVTPTVTAPTAKVLTYNGSQQELVNAGSTNFGTLQYRAGSDSWSTSIPTRQKGGPYVVQYRVVGDSNINDVAAESVQCSINEKQVTATVTLSQTAYTYNGSACQPTPTVKDGSTVIDPSEYGITYTNNINAGTGTVTISDNAGGDYEVIGSATFTINKANPTYTAPTAKSLTYNGSAQALLNAGSTNHGTIQYSSNGSNWGTTIPSQTNANTYTTYWKLVGDANHNDVPSTSISTTIAKANQSAPSVTGSTTTYPTTASATASGGGGQGSIEWESAQSQTSVGSHTTRARWSGNSNYNASPWSSSVTVQMNKAAGSVTTAPVNTNYTYNGTARAVASAGRGTGTMYYRLGTSGSFSTTMPTMTNAGSNTLYYYAAASTNYEQSATGSITVTVQKANISPTVSISNWTYGGTASNPSVAGNSGSGTVTYYYKLSSASSWSTTKPSNAGSYNIRADIAATTNYNSGTCTSNFTINKAAGSVSTAPANSNPGYGTRNYLCTEGSGTGTMMYRLGTSGSFSSTRPTASSSMNVGTYTLYYYAAESTNYNQSSTGSISVTISKRSRTISWDTTPVGVGYKSTITVSATPSLGSGDGTVTYSTSNSNIASVNGNVVSGKTLGSFTLTATISEGTNYTSASTSCSISVSYEYNYLTFNATSSGTFKFSGTSSTSMYYSLNNGSTWTALSNNTNTPTISAGSKIMWRSSRTPQSAKALGTFSSTSNFTVEGNIMSIMYGDDFRGRKTFLGTINQFNGLFKSCTHLTSATNLSLPATAITQSCYSRMFWDCENLIDAPSILPATKLADLCYSSMFYQCLNLKNPPTLPATTLGNGCYNGMFLNCIALETAPDLPATTLQQTCYGYMFNNCQSLTKIKCLATDISASDCTNEWVSYVPSSGTFIKASSMSSWTTGINGIPSGWSVQNA
jgi:hypothetical protein